MITADVSQKQSLKIKKKWKNWDVQKLKKGLIKKMTCIYNR